MTAPTSLPVKLVGHAPKNRRCSAISNELRHLIASGQLKPGDQLPTESVLCEQFGVSRTTLREAIQTLRTTGLLDVTPGRGSFVKIPDLKHLVGEMALVGMHSPTLASDTAHLMALFVKDFFQHFAKIPQTQRKELYQYTLNRLVSAEENAELEGRWFLEMATLAGNALQRLMMESLLALTLGARTQRYRNPDDILRTVHVQMRVNAALVDNDLALAERVMCQYLTPAPVSAAA